jgi:hypothetical protein
MSSASSSPASTLFITGSSTTWRTWTDGSESVDRGVAVALDLAERFDADLVAAGTRGRHGSHGYLLGSVAEGLLRTCDPPVLTVRQLEGDGEHAA